MSQSPPALNSEVHSSASAPVRTALLRAGTAIGAQLTLLAALLYYFGLLRNAAMTDYLGGTESHINASLEWHILSSAQALFTPLLIVAVTAVVWRLADQGLTRLLADRPSARRGCCLSLAASGAAMPAVAWAATRSRPGWWELGLPLSLTVGLLLGCYASSLWNRTASTTASETETETSGTEGYAPRREPWPASAGIPAAVLAVVLIFWTVGTLAAIQGRGEAERFVDSLDEQTGVAVFSAEDLQLHAPGLRVTVYTDGLYRYRYQGLKIYAYSAGKLFLVPTGWTYNDPRLIVLPEQDGIRVEYLGT